MKTIRLYQSNMIELEWNNYVNIFGESNVIEDEDTGKQYIEIYANTDTEVAIGTEAIKGIKKFQQDRQLDRQPFNVKVATANILEELLELNGYSVSRELLMDEFKEFIEKCIIRGIVSKNDTSNDFYIEDALCDIQVFAIGELMKRNQSPEIALLETSKEINSRVGHIVDGKFEKSIDPESKSKWYAANYNKSVKVNDKI